MMNSEDSEAWTTTIEAGRGWYVPDLRGLWQYRDLVMLFVRRDSVASYKQSLLGPLWFVIQPLMTTVVFTVVFGHIVSIPTDGIAPFLFYFAGVLCWQFFAGNLTRTSDTFAANAGIFSKVYFPRLVTPVSVIISNAIVFGIQFSFFIFVLLVYKLRGAGVQPNISLVLLPLLLVQIAALGLGIGLIISTLTIRYRDLNYLLGYGMQLWMYATPIVYPLSQVPEKWLWVAYINPMTAMVQTFRHSLLGSDSPRPEAIAYSIVATLVLLCVGLALFSRVERSFMDTI
jgi:homopolymeric O-antigen transport system permease protein